jgi:branched-chain amino acid transport system substrate-binding protein
MKRFLHWSCAAIVGWVWTVPVHAQSMVYIPDVVELSGPGAVSGTNWRDGAAMAIDEINKSGGILGRKIETEHLDTQSNPGVSRAQIQKVLDRDPYVVLGPIYSGSVKVNMALTQQAEVPQIVGAEAADITQQGSLPHRFRTAIQHAENRQLPA